MQSARPGRFYVNPAPPSLTTRIGTAPSMTSGAVPMAPAVSGAGGWETTQGGGRIAALKRYAVLDRFPRQRVRFFGEEIRRNYRCAVTENINE